MPAVNSSVAVGSLLSTILALTATLLALAVLVQVIQEIYKFLTNSRARAFALVLVDFLGPWGQSLLKSGAFAEAKVRGPFHLNPRSPRLWLLPPGEGAFRSMLDRTTPPLVQQALGALTVESNLQQGKPSGGSPLWRQFLLTLSQRGERDPNGFTAKELQRFFSTWQGDPDSGFDAARTLTAFRAQFLSHVDAVVSRFAQLMDQFEFVYRRRNLRQTFVLGFLLALLGNFPIGTLYQEAARVSPADAAALAQSVIALADKQVAADSTLQESLNTARGTLATLRATHQSPGPFLMAPSVAIQEGIIAYIGGCFVTALLLSFGAPFWNDLAKSLLRLQQSGPAASTPTPEVS